MKQYASAEARTDSSVFTRPAAGATLCLVVLFYADAVLTFLQAYNTYCAVKWLDVAGVASTKETREMRVTRTKKTTKAPEAKPTLSRAAARAARAARVKMELDLLAQRTTMLQTRLR